VLDENVQHLKTARR